MDAALTTESSFVYIMNPLTFAWTDYVLFVALLGVSLIIGIYFGFFSKQDSAKEYLFGGKTMAYLPVAMSVLASMLSGITFLGIPTEVYSHGAYYVLSAIPAATCCLTTAYIFMPIFYDLQLDSSYEYLELRFSKFIRSLASFLYIISLLLYIPIVIYVPALAFSQVSGYNIHLITPIFSLVCITYTTMGGVKAVIWTDTIQLFFTVAGLFTVLVIGVKSIGGIPEVWRISKEGGRLDILDLNPSPFIRTTFWSATIGMFFANVSRLTIGQKFVQRLISIEKETDIKKAIFLIGFGWISLQFCCVVTGLIVYSKYHACDPVLTKLVKRNDQILPYYVMEVANKIPGLPGVFLAGLVSSALSTMSASLNSLSGIIYEDFIDQWVEDSPKKDAKSANIMKIISFIIGIITIALIFVVEHLGTIFEMANSLSTVVDGPLLGLFVLGMFTPWVGKKGALSGGIISIVIMSWIVGGTQWHIYNKRIRQSSLPTSIENCPYPLNNTFVENTTLPPVANEDEPMLFFQISFLYLIFIGMFITVVVGSTISLIINESESSKVNARYIAPFLRRFLPKKQYVEVSLKEISPDKLR